MMMEKISTKDGLLYVGQNENPGKPPAEAEAHSKAPRAVGCNTASIDSAERRLRRMSGLATIRGRGGQDAYLCTSVNKETMRGEQRGSLT